MRFSVFPKQLSKIHCKSQPSLLDPRANSLAYKAFHTGLQMPTSLADINAQIKKNEEQLAQLKRQAEDFRSQERAGVIDKIRKKIAEYGLTAADLKLSSRTPK